jgi:hypothetical protein
MNTEAYVSSRLHWSHTGSKSFSDWMIAHNVEEFCALVPKQSPAAVMSTLDLADKQGGIFAPTWIQ